MSIQTKPHSAVAVATERNGPSSRARDGGAVEREVAIREPAEPASPRRGWYLPLKDATDFVLAALLLAVAGPVILVAAAVTRLTSSGPAFYRQTRLGRNGRPFRICKIRTMVHNAEARTGAVWAQTNDPRVTAWGRFLRTTHIDEFPQLIHVLSGRMSLIGPRPERPEFVHQLQWQIPHYSDRLCVKPGVTGLAQLLLPPDEDTDDVRRKVKHDLYYVRHLGPWLDLKIAGQTGWLLLTTLCSVAIAPLRLPNQEAISREVADLV